MAEIRSPLADATAIRRGDGLDIAEIAGRDLVQLAGWPAGFDGIAARLAELVGCPVPTGTRTAITRGAVTLFRVGPERLWIVAPSMSATVTQLRQAFAGDKAAVTELGHARTALRLAGQAAPDLLARCVAVDLDLAVFPPGAFAQTQLHQIGVLLHRVGDDVFELYIPRSYAASIWDWLQVI